MNIFKKFNNIDEPDKLISKFDIDTDLSISLKGYMHGDKGFILQVTNMTELTDDILQKWKTVVEKNGYECSMRYDFQDGWVDISCYYKKGSYVFFYCQQLIYLSFISFSIYQLCQLS